MSRFNLIDEPWIPVRLLDQTQPDGKRAELGIKDTLLRAKEIAIIEDPSPLVVASLHRFLLAVLYRALEGPTDIDQAKGWFKAGLPAEKIEGYLERWEDRFWLFEGKNPFFQTPGFEPKKWNAWTILAAEHNANNGKVLFDHIDVTQPGIVSAAAAVRWLLAAQTFAFTGNSELGYASFSPSANAVMAIPIGRNLEDTLLLCLVDQNRLVTKEDKPFWEMEPDSPDRLKQGIARKVVGHAQLYTWPSRTIRLRVSNEGVLEVAFAAGVRVADAAGTDRNATDKKPDDSKKKSKPVAFTDPMAAYHIDKDTGKQPRRFSERGLWRDFDSLLPDAERLAPAVIEHAAALTRFARERFPQAVMVLGQANNKAKIEYWRMERHALPASLVGNASARSEIHQLLKDAEQSGSALEAALRDWAKLIITKGDRDLHPDKWAKGKWVPGDVSRAIGKMSPDAPPSPALGYWSRLEAAFHDTLHHYTLERDPDAIRLDWLKTVRAALRDVWDQHAASVSTGDAWAIRALVRAEGAIGKQLKVLSDEIQKYECHLNPQEETA